jgi:anti-sigma factor RsiW
MSHPSVGGPAPDDEVADATRQMRRVDRRRTWVLLVSGLAVAVLALFVVAAISSQLSHLVDQMLR